jgi:hypothetical protein
MEQGSSPSVPRVGPRDLVVLGVGVVAALGTYLVVSALTYRLGFPLDDSWIHAVFARNLALHGEWAFRLGHPSAGSTSPLWTFVLVPGFWLHLEPLWWSYLLGAALLFALATLMEILARWLVVAYSPRVPWVGLFFVAEWHLQWAAVSGMETMLHAVLVSLVMGLILIGWRGHLVLGVLTGVCVWVRPDGLTMAAPALLVFLLAPGLRRERRRAIGAYLLGLAALLLPYLALNTWLSGNPMPNTFYAKQTEYAVWQARPIVERLGILVEQLIAGPALLLVPAIVLMAARAVRERSSCWESSSFSSSATALRLAPIATCWPRRMRGGWECLLSGSSSWVPVPMVRMLPSSSRRWWTRRAGLPDIYLTARSSPRTISERWATLISTR